MPNTTSYHTHVTSEHLKINLNEEIDSITTFIRDTMATELRRRGAIIALSGGIDSSVTAALCARALGPGEGNRNPYARNPLILRYFQIGKTCGNVTGYTQHRTQYHSYP